MKQKLFLAALALLLAVPAQRMYAYNYDFTSVAPTGQTLYYKIVNGSAQVAFPSADMNDPYNGYIPPVGDLEIPRSVASNGTNYTVTTIMYNAFYECTGITSVTIPSTITSIGNDAFQGCEGLTAVSYNATNCTSMGTPYNAVFAGCSNVTALNIGSNVTSIPGWAFRGFTGIRTVTIPRNVKSIGSSAFGSCSSLTTINFNADSCTSIVGGGSGYGSFSGCSNLTTINIGDNVKIIPAGAFSGCTGITSITIPHNVKTIGGWAFNGCTALTTCNFNADSCTSMGELLYPAFYGCSSLTQINIGDNVRSLPTNAFRGCTSLPSISIPNRIVNIPSKCFGGCNHVTSITLGSGIRTIAADAFEGCSAVLQMSVLASTPPTSPSNPFAEFNTGIQVKVPCNSVNAYQNAPYWGFFTNISGEFEYTFSVTSSDINKGSVHIAAAPSCDSRQAEFSATPYQGYRFVRWSDGNTQTPRYMVVTQDTVLTAYFEAAANGIEDVADEITVKVYPNPATSAVTVRVEGQEGTATVQLVDLNGREQGRWTMEGETLGIDLSGVAQGAYFVRITASGNTAIRKLIVR